MNKNIDKIKKMAPGLLPKLKAWRRDFHQHPELAFNEKRTSAKIADVLRKTGLKVQTGIGKTGVVGLLGAGTGRTVALRADMDALPVAEANKTEYRSRNQGVMHACGHDAHISMALGAAILLKRAGLPSGSVKFIFQPAEETTAGADAMINDGVMRDPKVDAIFALHVKPDLPFGSVALRDGPAMAAAVHFHIQVVGRGGHGARPDIAVDPLPAANAIYSALQTIRRNLSPVNPCVLSVCAFNAGHAPNIIPDTAEIRGTLRTYSAGMERQARAAIRAIVRNIPRAFNTRAELEFCIGTPVLNNSARPAAVLRQAASELGIAAREIEPMMVSEDFAFFQRHAPGVLAWLGTQRGSKTRNLHAPDFDFDENILPKGAALLAACAVKYLG